MNEEAISYIMQKMSNWLDNSQMVRLEKTLEEALRGEDMDFEERECVVIGKGDKERIRIIE